MFLGPMAMPFYRETGFTKIEVAEITNFYGLIMTILGGLFAELQSIVLAFQKTWLQEPF